MLSKATICVLLASAAVLAGCGGSGGGTSAEDESEIKDLVAKMNQATQDRDASAFCLIIQPSAIEKTFHDIDRCVSETGPILKAAGEQPVYKVERIEVDGDVARVSFSGSAGEEATFVRENGQWYLPLDPQDTATDPADSFSSGNEG